VPSSVAVLFDRRLRHHLHDADLVADSLADGGVRSFILGG